MDEVVWHSIPLLSGVAGIPQEPVNHPSSIVVDESEEDRGLQFSAQEMHRRFITELDSDLTLAKVRQTHIELLNNDFSKIEATRRAVAMIPTMELFSANLDGTILGKIIRIPMGGVTSEQIEIEVGMLGAEQIVKLVIQGSTLVERIARLGLGKRLESTWFQGGELNLKTS